MLASSLRKKWFLNALEVTGAIGGPAAFVALAIYIHDNMLINPAFANAAFGLGVLSMATGLFCMGRLDDKARRVSCPKPLQQSFMFLQRQAT